MQAPQMRSTSQERERGSASTTIGDAMTENLTSKADDDTRVEEGRTQTPSGETNGELVGTVSASEDATKKARLARLTAITGAPQFMTRWLDRIYSHDDIDLVLESSTGLLPGTHGETELERAVRRAVLDRQNGGFVPSSFHARYELWALYEHWADIPHEIRELLNEWELNFYLEEVGPGIKALADERCEDSDQADYTYLLLEEAEELLRTRTSIYLWPCNCRAMFGRCEKSQTVCLRFDNSRNVGWEITPERAIQILRQCDKEGLMHTAYLSSSHGHHGVCNCCSDCCFPILAGERLGAADVWPVRRHVAVVDDDACTLCGRCVKRCPFGALRIERSPERRLVINNAECRGCGVCATGCSAAALHMERRTGKLVHEKTVHD